MTPDDVIQVINMVMKAISWFSPIILLLSMLVFSLFLGAVPKWMFYMGWTLICTALWGGMMFLSGSGGTLPVTTPPDMKTLFHIAYGIFLLAFTTLYFVLPMALSNQMNYGIMGYMLCYLAYDMYCKRGMMSGKEMAGHALGGALLGAISATLMYFLPLKKYLYIDNGFGGGSGSSAQCSMPARNTFRCSVYKNGELVSSHMK